MRCSLRNMNFDYYYGHHFDMTMNISQPLIVVYISVLSIIVECYSFAAQLILIQKLKMSFMFFPIKEKQKNKKKMAGK